MVVTYRIRFEQDGVTIQQSVSGQAVDAGGGSFPTDHGGGSFPTDRGGGSFPTDHGGGSFPTDHGGGAGSRLVAVILGPLVIGMAGPAGPPKAEGEPAPAGMGDIVPPENPLA